MKKNILTLLSVFALLVGCADNRQNTPEERVKAVLTAVEEAIESRSLSDIMAHVSEAYQDHEGHDKNVIKRLMQLQLVRNQNINIFTRIHSLSVADNLATVELSAAMAARDVDLSQESNRLKADTHRFSLVLANEDTHWRLVSASWQRGW